MSDSKFLTRPYRNKKFQKHRTKGIESKLRRDIKRYKAEVEEFKVKLEAVEQELKDARILNPAGHSIPEGVTPGGNSLEEYTTTPSK